MLESILTTDVSGAATFGTALLCTMAALVLGIMAAAFYTVRNTYTKSFVVTLALMPAMVQVVILLVNGNLGTGVAVMGAFGLVRFRSVPGSAREICAIFLAMGIGLACGVGYVGYAAVFALLICLVQLALILTPFGESKAGEKQLSVTIPENLDYEGLLDDIFRKFTTESRLEKVRTTGMGSMYEMKYILRMKPDQSEKAMIDTIRCRNGNLPITCGKVSTARDEL